MAAYPRAKICGLTRPEDAALAASLGAGYVGVITVGGPRKLDAAAARAVLASAVGPQRVAVVAKGDPAAIADLALACGADIVQLHADPEPAEITALRRHWSRDIWAVVRLGAQPDAGRLRDLAREADGVVADTAVPGGLGGSGVRFDWQRHAASLEQSRANALLVLAGGLTPDNISEAVRALHPDVVDVSSGVEDAPGIKSADRMRAFMHAVAPPSPVIPA